TPRAPCRPRRARRTSTRGAPCRSRAHARASAAPHPAREPGRGEGSFPDRPPSRAHYMLPRPLAHVPSRLRKKIEWLFRRAEGRFLSRGILANEGKHLDPDGAYMALVASRD